MLLLPLLLLLPAAGSQGDIATSHDPALQQ
jgi:hypothetical protein